MIDKNMLLERLKEINLFLNDNQIEQFLTYYDMLIEKNKVMNLTAITEYEEVVKKHFIDSLAVIRVYDMKKDLSIVDLGTGAGFPGIPLKIAFPNLKIILVDSLNKRINFLNEVIHSLELKDISAIHARAEDLGKDANYREQFDLCISRAVANLSILSEYCIPFVKKDGMFISYKSGSVKEELENSQKAIQLFGGRIEKIDNFIIPGTNIERSLIVIRKEENTPPKYPRSSGKPQKEPIC